MERRSTHVRTLLVMAACALSLFLSNSTDALGNQLSMGKTFHRTIVSHATIVSEGLIIYRKSTLDLTTAAFTRKSGDKSDSTPQYSGRRVRW